MIERKGTPFALLYTEGFKDVLEIGREHRYSLTDLKLRFPEPVSERHLRFSVAERTSAAGDVVVAHHVHGDAAEACRREVAMKAVRSELEF